METTDFYVSTLGNDSSRGTAAEPFATPEGAIRAVRELCSKGLNKPVNVFFHAGNYKVSTLPFDKGCSGTKECPITYKAFGDGAVIFNGGTVIPRSSFKRITDSDILSRLADSVKDKVLVCDLKKEGITAEQIGPVYPIGAVNESIHFNIPQGNNCELFWNSKRLPVARYPDSSFLLFEDIIEQGNKEKHIPGVLELDADTMARIKSWKEPEKAWMFAYFKYTWSENTTPIEKYNFEENTVKPLITSTYGYGMEKSKYYFYNVLEELDAPGEYYIDRDNMLLYVCPPDNNENAEIIISLSTEVLISGTLAHTTFESIEFTGIRNSIVNLNCNYVSFINCKLSNSYGSGIGMIGVHNRIYGCELCSLGRGGITISGGDRATLTHAENIVENCYIHHFEEIYRTYQYGIYLTGCGNSAIHNEICYAPHLAAGCYGNENIFAYNYIHDVVYESEDSGAFYIGGDWSSTGFDIKYNYFQNIGSKNHDCKCIYFDDGMSGGNIFGNICENCSGWSLNFGGGFGITVKNNIVLSAGVPLHYDQRMGRGGWADMTKFTKPGEGLWTSLDRVPYMSDLYREKYPLLSQLKHDYKDKDDKFFPANPGNSLVAHNVFIGPESAQDRWAVEDDVYLFSTVEDNYTFLSREDILKDGSFELKTPLDGVEPIPFGEIGRYGFAPKPVEYPWQGKMKITLADGSIYDGDLVMNQMRGIGKRIYPDGRIFEGEWYRDIIGRNGKMTFPDGRVYEGEWYVDMMNDHGVMTYPDNSRYEGNFDNNKRSGNGKMTFSDGSTYEGEWKKDRMNGKGKMTYADGSCVEGEWIKGVFKG